MAGEETPRSAASWVIVRGCAASALRIRSFVPSLSLPSWAMAAQGSVMMVLAEAQEQARRSHRSSVC
jgi:hypothetical protein